MERLRLELSPANIDLEESRILLELQSLMKKNALSIIINAMTLAAFFVKNKQKNPPNSSIFDCPPINLIIFQYNNQS